MHSWMIREHKVSVIKRSEKIFQVHFVHKTIKKRFHSSAAQEPGPLKSQRFFMAFLSLAVRLFRKASTSAWCMITDRDFFFWLEISSNTENSRTEAHFFRCYFFSCWWLCLAARWSCDEFTCVVFPFMVHTLLIAIHVMKLVDEISLEALTFRETTSV